jgi:SWI/SNF related-matrix-associated actin-dependent regulator of chromatin subfamily C
LILSFIILTSLSFNSGKYPPELSHDDFVLVKGDVNLNESDSWTEEERLLLLEGLETHGEDWDAVAAHVGKSKRECMEYFVRMPIEDTFLEQSDNFIGIKHKEQTDQTTEYLPFGDLGNPVLAQVAFIASMISPAVGAAAAAKAVEKISVMKKSEDDQNASSQMVVDDVDEGSLAAGKKPFLTSEEIKEVSLESIASAALKAKDLSEKEFKQIVSAVLELVSIQMKKTE